MIKRLFILLICSFILNNSYASINFYEAQLIYEKLKNANGIPNAPVLVLNGSTSINAETQSNQIIVNKGMLDFVDNNDQLALVLGHELAHWVNHDYLYFPIEWKEYRADSQGLQYMENAGYNHCRGIKVFKQFKKRMGDSKSDGVHPSDIDRYNYLHRGCWF